MIKNVPVTKAESDMCALVTFRFGIGDTISTSVEVVDPIELDITFVRFSIIGLFSPFGHGWQCIVANAWQLLFEAFKLVSTGQNTK